ncbi:glycosyltransferase [Bellilinea caldifistulae]|uniref:Glycosyl transferase family 1 domain-containing protein n=1 Tax=Bellilinea caldifistulae TaxID=360411 RepID=A0A0P6X1B7_9CHLR|nr:glycosyltransferase family 4 protein [Bellilinea caldifistulae]KPL73137.1 hypothetical protein AC812_15245 [Bellilinea caldifistulae]GAP10999.1 glycosyltransferase [Bellilinea caldifistulae]
MKLDFSANLYQSNELNTPLIVPSDRAFRIHRYQLFSFPKSHSQVNWLCLPVSGTNVLHDWLKLERLWSTRKITSAELEYVVSIVSNEFERSAILRGLIRNPSINSLDTLLAWISDDTLNNSLIIEIFKQNISSLKNFSVISQRLTSLLGNPSLSEKQATTLLSLAALHPAWELPQSLTETIFKRYYSHPAVAFALLEYLVSHHNIDFLNRWIEKTLSKSEVPYPLNLAVWLSLKQIQPWRFEAYFSTLQYLDCRENPCLNPLKNSLEKISSFNQEQNKLPHNEHDLTIAQFMFFGSIHQPGVGDSGGLSIFLNQLGNALAENENIRQILTFVTSPLATSLLTPVENGNQIHLLVTLPIHDNFQVDKDDFVAYPLQLKTFLRLFLNQITPLPDIFHLRFNDIRTFAVAEIAREMNIKTILTLTADPHRAIEKHYESRSNLQPEDIQILNQSLFRVLIADQLLHQSDAVVILPSKQGILDLLPYFPQLTQIIRKKTFTVIPEGLEVASANFHHIDPIQPVLTRIKRSSDDSSHANRRLILSVGRLSPIKQQNLLVEAWLKSDLWQSVDLVLIGGSPSNPTPSEQKMLRSIEKLLEQNPAAMPFFFLLPAMPNHQIRALESYLSECYPLDQPPVYVCSSLKEEFGIAILEAMSAGWLAIGPKAGGLSSYIRDGENGFLMDTSEVNQLGDALLEILSLPGQKLQKIALAGKKTVQENYDIHRIAQLLIDLYIKTTSESNLKPPHENHPDYQPAVLLAF